MTPMGTLNLSLTNSLLSEFPSLVLSQVYVLHQFEGVFSLVARCAQWWDWASNWIDTQRVKLRKPISEFLQTNKKQIQGL